MAKKTGMTRRRFLGATGAAATAAVWTAKSYAQVAGANERLNVGFIGCGGMGGGHLGALLKMREAENLGFAGVCDVYETRARSFARRIKDARAGSPKVTQDYRELLAMDDLDYVVIPTPEHSHAYLALAALDAGKHVYVEKPMARYIDEAQQIVAKVNETGLKVQVGVQGMCDDSYESANAAIRAGKLGPVVQAQIDYVRHYGKAGPWRHGTDPNMAKPEDLDWDGWLRPAPQRVWEPGRYFEWQDYWDYSGGIASGLFVHRITRLIKACDLTFPSRVVGLGGMYIWPDGRELPDNMEMLLEYPAVEGVTPGMTVHLLGTMANDMGNKHCIRGHKASLIFTGQGWEIIEQGSGKVIEKHQKTGGEDIALHHKNHHAAIREGTPLKCPVELGLYGVVAVCMGNDSWRKQKLLTWDTERAAAVPA